MCARLLRAGLRGVVWMIAYFELRHAQAEFERDALESGLRERVAADMICK